MDYRTALIEFYQKHNPEKIKEIDLLLSKYRGREEELLHALRVKYGVHKTVSPTQQQQPIQPQPPPKSMPSSKSQPPPAPQNRQQPQTRQSSRPQSTEPTEPTDSASAGQSRAGEYANEPSGISGYRGRSAAERAEYWRKQLERRERERAGQEGRSDKFTEPADKKEPPGHDSRGTNKKPAVFSAGGFVTTLILILVIVALVGGMVTLVILYNRNLRSDFMTRLRPEKKTEQAKQEKKEGIEPDVLAQKRDTAAVAAARPTGEFALDSEEDYEGNEGGTLLRDDSQNTPDDAGQPASQQNDNKKTGSLPPPESKGSQPGTLKRNAWYISYITLSEESSAQKAVRQLQAEGYTNAGYYYIPDYDPRGKSMYKVYVGPFPTLEEAESVLYDNLKNISPGSYPYLLK